MLAHQTRNRLQPEMTILNVLMHIAGATMLLLFAVRMVRTGIERSCGAHFRAMMTRHRSRLRSGMIGVIMAMVLQSSSAVALLAAGFASTGLLSFGAGLAILLGADLGSAIVVRILSFRLEWLIPLLLMVGGGLFINSGMRDRRQAGRVLMGIAFILIALQFLRAAVDPIRDSALLPAIASYLADDFVTAFLVGTTLAFVMHSSVAAILMCVTLVQIGALPFAAGLSVVLGANLGGAVIPVWLTRRMSVQARRIPLANVGLRGGWALCILLAVNWLPAGDILRDDGNAMMLIYSHIAFNALLLILALPCLAPLDRLVRRLLPDAPVSTIAADGVPESRSALDLDHMDHPSMALASLKRELSRMNDLVGDMFTPLMQIYEIGDVARINGVRAVDSRVNGCLSGIRDYVASIPLEHYSKPERRIARDMVEYAIHLESAGDLIAKRLTTLAEDLHHLGARFSQEGWSELVAMHALIMANLKLAGNVLISDDLESARVLNLEKEEVKRAERSSRSRHLKRLRKGVGESLATSDIHLETLMAFREFNRYISAVADPILYQHGQLLETRLIDRLEKAHEIAT